mgnify:CR=1 FL=1
MKQAKSSSRTNQQADTLASGPQPLDLQLLSQVVGGSPKGTWGSPKGTWGSPKGTWGSPKGTWGDETTSPKGTW